MHHLAHATVMSFLLLSTRMLPGVLATWPSVSPCRDTVHAAPGGVVAMATLCPVPSTIVAQPGRVSANKPSAERRYVNMLRFLPYRSHRCTRVERMSRTVAHKAARVLISRSLERRHWPAGPICARIPGFGHFCD